MRSWFRHIGESLLDALGAEPEHSPRTFQGSLSDQDPALLARLARVRPDIHAKITGDSQFVPTHERSEADLEGVHVVGHLRGRGEPMKYEAAVNMRMSVPTDMVPRLHGLADQLGRTRIDGCANPQVLAIAAAIGEINACGTPSRPPARRWRDAPTLRFAPR